MSISVVDVKEAAERVRKYVRKTPLDYSPALSEMFGAEVYLKLENLQKTGSFKLRGAANKLQLLSEEEKEAGAITASAGNHAQGVAFMAKELGVDTLIVIPESAPQTKIDNTKRYGVNVLVQGKDYDDSERIAHRIEKETGRTYIHAFDDPAIWAGQGTVALEVLDEMDDLDMIIVPVGGGGLMTGVGTAVKGVNPDIQVVGVQPEVSKLWYESFHQKRYVDEPYGDSWADGLTGEISESMVDGFIKVVDDMAIIDEESIKKAIYFMIEKHHLIVEGSGTAGIAAVMSGKIDIRGKKVAIILTGSNLDTKRVKTVLDEFVK